MIDWLTPGPLYNEITSGRPLSGPQIMAGPFGLLLFIPIIPFAWLIGRRFPATAICVTGLAWLVLTLSPLATLTFLACVAVGALWVVLLGTLRRRGWASEQATIAATWLGLHALAYPLWLRPNFFAYGWEGGGLATLHALGLAYFLFRFVAWGVDWAKNPQLPLRPRETVAWLLYPPIMRLGPVMTRELFIERFERWRPAARKQWRAIAIHFCWLMAGGIAYGVLINNTPRVPPGATDFFAAPQNYRTDELVRLIYQIPLRIYLILWMYNELAAIASKLVGIPTDNNFDRVPHATSIRDFWRRWHITVGAWLRTYMYIPLGGSRRHVDLNYLLVFGYCGIWHGASWSFLAWGLLQGMGLIVQRWWDKLRVALGWGERWHNPLWKAFCWFVTMNYAAVTIFVFTDFEYLGTRVFAELWRRAFG